MSPCGRDFGAVKVYGEKTFPLYKLIMRSRKEEEEIYTFVEGRVEEGEKIYTKGGKEGG